MTVDNSRKEVESIIREQGIYASATRGRSMRPLFKEGRDVVYISTPSDSVKKYDVLLYESGNRLVLHRVIAIRDDVYVIRGDNTYYKEYVKKSDVIGSLVGYTRNGKYKDSGSLNFKFFAVIAIVFYPLRRLLRGVKHRFAHRRS